ncbi:hypothetical protein FB567DRAFT_614473 [Paraphoma chrysanthemicola]|uniref:DUF7580 domain-containing protein n=1 Tax=Paraphoma chrysanthemicola TaxID=798071 RepID=A0A8K0RFZ0_9PLEO|nr:hypothetical protein FB567DRAFT_614473 [Paraphoma chrysanthemicola]
MDHAPTKQRWESRAVEVEPTEESNTPSSQPANSPPMIMIHSSSTATSPWQHCLQAAPKIDDLCLTLSASTHKGLCMGVLNDTCIKHHMHLAPRLPLPKSIQNRITLQDILAADNGASFPIKEKCTLVLALANAVMQLHDTPWLGETWTSNDICMLSYNNKGTSMTEEPYVWKNFKSISKACPPIKKNPFVRNATIFALGVTLLEISYGRRLETFQTPDDLDDNGNRTPLTDCSIAYRLVETVHHRELPNFANAARRCVHCSFDVVVHSLKDDDLRERFYQGVVVPLRQDYEYATNGS